MAHQKERGMSPETKARLREYAAAKRARTARPADITATDIAVACDYACERLGFAGPPEVDLCSLAHLRRVPKQLESDLMAIAPHFLMRIGCGPGRTRIVAVFDLDLITEIMAFLRLDKQGKRGHVYYRQIHLNGRGQKWAFDASKQAAFRQQRERE